jgi:hypothetical protein
LSHADGNEVVDPRKKRKDYRPLEVLKSFGHGRGLVDGGDNGTSITVYTHLVDNSVDSQMERASNQRDHVLRRPLEMAITSSGSSAEEIAETVLRTLNDHGLIQYAQPGTMSLLSTAGRVLVCVSERPQITLREMALILGVTESGIAKTIAGLVKSGVIARTKVKGRNIYSVDKKQAQNHPDIHRYFAAIKPIFEKDETTH